MKTRSIDGILQYDPHTHSQSGLNTQVIRRVVEECAYASPLYVPSPHESLYERFTNSISTLWRR